MIESSIKNIISKFISKQVKFAYIFGSALTKYFNETSDIDLAVWLNNYPIEIKDITDLKYSIEELLGFKYDIDLIILNEADLIISNQVITKGELIIDNAPPFTENYIISRRSLYMEFKSFRKNLEENLIKHD